MGVGIGLEKKSESAFVTSPATNPFGFLALFFRLIRVHSRG